MIAWTTEHVILIDFTHPWWFHLSPVIDTKRSTRYHHVSLFICFVLNTLHSRCSSCAPTFSHFRMILTSIGLSFPLCPNKQLWKPTAPPLGFGIIKQQQLWLYLFRVESSTPQTRFIGRYPDNSSCCSFLSSLRLNDRGKKSSLFWSDGLDREVLFGVEKTNCSVCFWMKGICKVDDLLLKRRENVKQNIQLFFCCVPMFSERRFGCSSAESEHQLHFLDRALCRIRW